MTRESFKDLVRKLGGEVLDVGVPVKTVEQAFRATGTTPSQIIKSMLLVSEKEGVILAIVDGRSRVDLEKLSQRFGRIRLATPSEVKEFTGYEIGALPPIGLPIKTIIDPYVLEKEYVVGGGGAVDKLIKIDPKKILEVQKAEVMEISEVEK